VLQGLAGWLAPAAAAAAAAVCQAGASPSSCFPVNRPQPAAPSACCVWHLEASLVGALSLSPLLALAGWLTGWLAGHG